MRTAEKRRKKNSSSKWIERFALENWFFFIIVIYKSSLVATKPVGQKFESNEIKSEKIYSRNSRKCPSMWKSCEWILQSHY